VLHRFSYLCFKRVEMQRFSVLLAALWATNVYGQQFLASVAGGVGDTSLTSNCGSTFQSANAVRANL
jgi:hypothetical protein